MMMKSLDISGKIDPSTIAIYELLASTAASIGLEYVVIGATARDLILELGYNIPTTRATIDIDLGIEVEDWNQFKKFKDMLLATGRFTDTPQVQRLMYNNTHPIDILPYGNISNDGTNIKWPPDQSIQMSIAGFKEAYETSIKVLLRTDPLLEIRVASPPGLVALKLIAWKDRGVSQNKDARDIATIMKSYGKIQANIDRLYTDEIEILESEEFDTDLAGARLLGKDMAKLSGPGLLRTIKEILSKETASDDHNKLAESMSASIPEFDFDTHFSFLKKMEQGLEDL